MDLPSAIKLLREHNAWRRGDESIEMHNPREIGEAIDILVQSVERLRGALVKIRDGDHEHRDSEWRIARNALMNESNAKGQGMDA